MSTNQDLGIKVTKSVGNLVGPLLFVLLTDVLGQKRMCKQHPPIVKREKRSGGLLHFINQSLWHFADGIELMIMITGTFVQALTANRPVVTGVGVASDYPLNAVISSEFAATRIRGCLMTAMFAAQEWGNFCTFALTSEVGSSVLTQFFSSCCFGSIHDC